MIRYPLSYNPIIEYYEKIKNGEEVVGRKIRAVYENLYHDLTHESEYFYSPKRGNHVIEFVENYCKHSKGKMGGKPVKLELWEKAMLAAAFGFVDINGNRKYREVMLIVAKKNGKSLISSAVGLYLLVADGEPGPEIYAVATKRDQAKIIWMEAKRMVRKSAVLSKRVKPLVNDLISDFNDGTFKPVASDSDTLDGLNIHGVLMDEIHQWKNGRPLYDIMADGITAREQPMIFITSTAGVVREDIYDQKYQEAENVINGYSDPEGYHDEHFLPFIYELDERKEWENPDCWKKPNPGLGTIKNAATFADKVRKAQSNPRLVKNLLCKEFNVPETSQESWLTFEQVQNHAKFDLDELRPKYAIGGADLSSGVDLTAAVVLFKLRGDDHVYVQSMFWIPEDMVEQKVHDDKVPYDVWIEKGYVRTCPGNKIYAKCVTEWFLEMMQDHDVYIPWVGYDAWSAQYWVEEMKNHFGPDTMIPVHQGKKTLSAPMKALGADIERKLVNYNDNPVMRWCLYNTSYDEDKNGNIQPCKTSKSWKRIDGMAAMLDAYVIMQEKSAEYETMI